MTRAQDPKQYVIIDSWLWTPGCGGIWEPSLRHLRGISEASLRHLGGVWEASGSLGGIREHPKASGSKVCSNTCVLSVKVSRATFRVAFGASTLTLIGNLQQLSIVANP